MITFTPNCACEISRNSLSPGMRAVTARRSTGDKTVSASTPFLLDSSPNLSMMHFATSLRQREWQRVEGKVKTGQFLRHRAFRSISVMLLDVGLFMLVAPRNARADSIFNVSGTFTDNSSTSLTGTLTINTITGAVDGFDFNIPTMTVGSTTLAGALFTPSTATVVFFAHAGGSEIDFQLFGAPPQGETLFSKYHRARWSLMREAHYSKK